MPAQGPRTSPESAVPRIAAAAIISGVAALAWLPTVAGLTSLTGSDAAGNAMSQAYTAIAMGFVWILLAILALVAWIKGDMPWPLALAALIFIPAACIGSFTALGLLTSPSIPPYLLPIIVPAVAPPFIVLFCFWALAPAFRHAVPPAIAGGVVFGVIFVLCAALYPMGKAREAVHEQEAQDTRRYDEEFAALKPDAPLWEWTRFLQGGNEMQRTKVVETIRALPRRQSEAEIMLGRGDFPMGYLARLDLDPTPAVCEGARAQLRKQAASLMPAKPNTRKYIEITMQVNDALAAFRWLIGYGCNADAEVTAWENTANSYTDTNYDTVELRELHDPKLLGKVLREQPERFSMLTQQSHLKGWLKFVDNKDLHDKVLAGARTLPNRTSDAVEMFNDKYSNIPAWVVLQYMPVLDLEATPPLCAAALRLVREDFAKVYKPRPEDPPRPYSELLDRLGADDPLTALVWLGTHGCDAEVALSEAEAVIRAYQDSRGRAEMLAQLVSLHKKQ